MKNGTGYVILAALGALTLSPVNPATRGDGFFYFAHLRSAVVDGDLHFENELRYADDKVRSKFERVYAVTGSAPNKFGVGPVLSWAPYYVPVHVAGVLAARAGARVTTDGFAPQYLWAVAAATALYVFAGVLLVARMVSRYYSAAVALAAAAGIWFATSLPAYAFFHPTMSHGVSFFVAASFLFLWLETRGGRTWLQLAALGALGGLAATVRLQDAALLLLPAGEYAATAWRAAVRRGRPAAAALRLAAVAGSAALAFVPQLAAWRITHGSFFRTGYETEMMFAWTRPRVGGVLFSTWHGALLWTPILAAAGAAVFSLQVYVVGAWWYWAQGSSFGGRMLISTYPFLAFGLAAGFDLLARRVGRWAPWALVAVLTAWNANLLFLFGAGLIPREAPVPLSLVLSRTREVPARAWALARGYFRDRSAARKYFKEAR